MRDRKAKSERIVADSTIHSTILRAAQFHDVTLTTVQAMAKAPVLVAPNGIRWQPVASREVAARLAELTLGRPAGRVADLAGPRTYTLEELQRSYLETVGKRRVRLPIRVPGKAGKGVPRRCQPVRGEARRHGDLGGVPGSPRARRLSRLLRVKSRER
jgi:uncharacterized protein YbjT (DUF2867 family)